MERTYLSIIKAIYDKPTANIILKGKKLKAFSSKVRNKTRVPTVTTIQHSFGRFSHSNHSRKRNKSHPNWKEEGKLTLLAVDMILYTENYKPPQKMIKQMKSKWIKTLNERLGTMKLLEVNVGRTLFDIIHSNIFFSTCLLRQRKQKKKMRSN